MFNTERKNANKSEGSEISANDSGISGGVEEIPIPSTSNGNSITNVVSSESDPLEWIEYYYEEGRSLGSIHSDSLHAVYKRQVAPYEKKFSSQYPSHGKRTQAVINQFRQVFAKTIESLTQLESSMLSDCKQKFPEMNEDWCSVSRSPTSSQSSWDTQSNGSSNSNLERRTSTFGRGNDPRDNDLSMNLNEDLIENQRDLKTNNNMIHLNEQEDVSTLENDALRSDRLRGEPSKEGNAAIKDNCNNSEVSQSQSQSLLHDLKDPFDNDNNINDEGENLQMKDTRQEKNESHHDRNHNDSVETLPAEDMDVDEIERGPIKGSMSDFEDVKVIMSNNFNSSGNLCVDSSDDSHVEIADDREENNTENKVGKFVLLMTENNELTMEMKDEKNDFDNQQPFMVIPKLESVELVEKKLSNHRRLNLSEHSEEDKYRRIALSISSDEEEDSTIVKNSVGKPMPKAQSPVSTQNEDPKLLEDNAVVQLIHLPPVTENDLKKDGFINLSQNVCQESDINADNDKSNADSDSSLCELDRMTTLLKNFNAVVGKDSKESAFNQNSSPKSRKTKKTKRRRRRMESECDQLQSSEDENLIQNEKHVISETQILMGKEVCMGWSSGSEDLYDISSSDSVKNPNASTKDRNVICEKQGGEVSKDKKRYKKLLVFSSSDDSESEARKKVLAKDDSDDDIDDYTDLKQRTKEQDSDDILSSHSTKTEKVESDNVKDSSGDSDSDILSVHSNANSDFETFKKGKRKSRGFPNFLGRFALSSSSTDEDEDRETKKQRRTVPLVHQNVDAVNMGIPEQSNFPSTSNFGNRTIQETEAVPIPAFLKRKNIRYIMSSMDLQETTRRAEQEEEQRKKRVTARQKLFSGLSKTTNKDLPNQLVLDIDLITKKPVIEVDKAIVCKLKPHQVEGIKFLYTSCLESVEMIKKSKGGGCILAHCMGLGKTLQAVGFTHTLLRNQNVTGIKTVLIVCPLNTVNNWFKEYAHWLQDADENVVLHPLHEAKTPTQRVMGLKTWQKTGGVGIMHYERFRVLVNQTIDEVKKNPLSKSHREAIYSALLDPGPDMVICDEGHLLKNHESLISEALSQIKTLRRVVLTGTPLQNNLTEYHTMMNFVKPHLLGNREEFTNRFVNPIKNGQCKDSNAVDVQIMKRRAHVLHSKLEGCVQRLDYTVLVPFLPPKHEYCILIKLSEKQKELYRHYLDTWCSGNTIERGKYLLQNYAALVKIVAHPVVLTMRKQLTLESEDEQQGLNVKRRTTRKLKATTSKRATKTDNLGNEWWSSIFQNTEDMYDVNLSGKIVLLQEILKNCELMGDRILVFSQYLTTLNIVEQFLEQWDNTARENNKTTRWRAGTEYFRIDGSTHTDDRQKYCDAFNVEGSSVAKLFLISTKAGGLGINLYGANRVVIFDVSWNPSNDMQSIFRVFRFGQVKPCYIYRFVAHATMEEKIYNRQVVKLSLSSRVVDEHQIERHFKFDDINELYTYNPDDKSDRPVPALPKDRLLANLLISHKDWIDSYFEHDSLLVNKEDEELSEQERCQAWAEYRLENEKHESPSWDMNIGTLQKIKDMLHRRDPAAPPEKIEHTATVVWNKINEVHQQKLHRRSMDGEIETNTVNEEKELQDFITNSWNSWSSTSTENTTDFNIFVASSDGNVTKKPCDQNNVNNLMHDYCLPMPTSRPAGPAPHNKGKWKAGKAKVPLVPKVKSIHQIMQESVKKAFNK